MSLKRAALLLLLVGCDRAPAPATAPASSSAISDENAAPAVAVDNWYPVSITPPPGTQYPCAVTAMPASMEGIPASQHRFVNHAFALLLQAVHARLKAYYALGGPPPAAMLEAYLRSTREIQAKFRDEPTPRSMEPFRDDILAAMDLQMTFFTKAFDAKRAGSSWEQITQIPEGHAGSGRLQAALAKFTARYPNSTAEMKASMEHHL